jgi:hypothetical protein
MMRVDKRWPVRKFYLLVAAPVMIFAGLSVVGLALLRNQPATALQINRVSTSTAIAGCPPRPTRTPVPVPTPRKTPPTPVPPPTPGALRIETPVYVPTLVHPLETEEDVLKVALDADMRGAYWGDPWCLETPRLQPGRITVKWYPNQNAYDGSGRPAEYGGTDPVWVVTIKGNVNMPMPGGGCRGPLNGGGVRYIIDQETGQLFGMGCLAPQ